MKPRGKQPQRSKKRRATATGIGDLPEILSGRAYDAQGAARAMGLTVNAVRLLCKRGLLEHYKHAAGYRIMGSAIEDLYRGVQPIQTNEEPGQ